MTQRWFFWITARSVCELLHPIVRRDQVMWSVLNTKSAGDTVLRTTQNLAWAVLVPRGPCALSAVCTATAGVASQCYRRPSSQGGAGKRLTVKRSKQSWQMRQPLHGIPQAAKTVRKTDRSSLCHDCPPRSVAQTVSVGTASACTHPPLVVLALALALSQ